MPTCSRHRLQKAPKRQLFHWTLIGTVQTNRFPIFGGQEIPGSHVRTGSTVNDITIYVDGTPYTIANGGLILNADNLGPYPNFDTDLGNSARTWIGAFSVGSNYTSPADYFQGDIKQFRIYKRALSGTEISANFANTCNYEPMDASLLLARMPLNEGSTATAPKDLVYNSTGTYYNMSMSRTGLTTSTCTSTACEHCISTEYLELAGASRFGFGGQELDNEIFGNDNIYTAEFWEYDARLGRRWNCDHVFKAWESSYATFGNNPIYYTDPTGASTEETDLNATNGGKEPPSKKGEKFIGDDGKEYSYSSDETVVEGKRPGFFQKVFNFLKKGFKTLLGILKGGGFQIYGEGGETDNNKRKAKPGSKVVPIDLGSQDAKDALGLSGILPGKTKMPKSSESPDPSKGVGKGLEKGMEESDDMTPEKTNTDKPALENKNAQSIKEDLYDQLIVRDLVILPSGQYSSRDSSTKTGKIEYHRRTKSRTGAVDSIIGPSTQQEFERNK